MYSPLTLVRKSTEECVTKARHVKIDNIALEQFANNLDPADCISKEFTDENFPKRLSEEETFAFIMLFDVMNFCFWCEPKWLVQHDNKQTGGSAGLLLVVTRVIEKNRSLLTPTKAHSSQLVLQLKEEFSSHGNTIPMLDRRLQNVKRLWLIVAEQHKTFHDIYRRCEGDAEMFIKHITSGPFASLFDDVSDCDRKPVAFYKRAQLVVEHLTTLGRIGKFGLQFTGSDKLTALADYKIPQVLNVNGILEYSTTLMNKIKNQEQLRHGSTAEVEIRSATVQAVERIAAIVTKKNPSITANMVGYACWQKSRLLNGGTTPHHRTYTSAY
jgi:hypothetical protein